MVAVGGFAVMEKDGQHEVFKCFEQRLALVGGKGSAIIQHHAPQRSFWLEFVGGFGQERHVVSRGKATLWSSQNNIWHSSVS